MLRSRTLASQILVAVLSILVITVSLGAILYVQFSARSLDRQYELASPWRRYDRCPDADGKSGARRWRPRTRNSTSSRPAFSSVLVRPTWW